MPAPLSGDPDLPGGKVRDDLHPDTIAIAAGRSVGPGDALNPPLVLSSTFRAGGEITYGRNDNSTWQAFESALGELERGRALCFASGTAATAAVLERLPSGAIVAMARNAYYGSRVFLAQASERGRLEARLVDVTDTGGALAACEGASLLWLESPTNPLLEIADLHALVSGAHDRGAAVCVDNTLATPLLQRPLDLGADVVVHSVTKYLAGHSDVLLGGVVARDGELVDEIKELRTRYGGVPGPVETFLALRGVRTLALRVERAQASAGILAPRLARHPSVQLVRYPGLKDHPGHEVAVRQMNGYGGMLSFEVRGGIAAADAMTKALEVVVDATSLGGVETTIDRRSKYAGERGVPEALLRLSVGCEHVEDLWADLRGALDSITA
jgi:cystathionine gamma-synthase